MIRSNLSAFIRSISSISGPKLFHRCGGALEEAIKEDFDELLESTAQYSGSTVASYRIGVGRNVEDTYVDLPIPENASAAFERGDQPAINIARAANADSLPSDGTLYQKLKTSDILVKNGSPAWERVETGEPPLRAVNQESVGAFKEFEDSVGNRVIDVNLGDL